MENQRLCPVWGGYIFLLPLRKFQHDPQKILEPFIKPGMTVMDFGCAMGYFSIPLAKMTGEQGKVYCVDIQEKMLVKLQLRAIKYGVSDIIKPLLAGKNYNPVNLNDTLDFALLFMVVHEVPDKAGLFRDMFAMLKQGGKILFFEPKGHVSEDDFDKSLRFAKNAGFKISDEKPMKKGLNAFLLKE
jgi:ubiquinone/menaquinone biosynthesis C-methylase UbiE